MKTKRLQFAHRPLQITVLLIMPFLFARCIGPEGPMGPQGPAGYDGLDGINYVRSVVYDVAPASWEGDVNGYRAYLDVPEITNDIYYNGAVLVYRLFETEPKSFNSLPYTYVDNALTVYMDFDAYVGGIDLLYKEIFDGVNDTPAPDGDMAFKIVIIEGIPLTQVKEMVDISDISAVAEKFNMDLNSSILRMQ